MSKNTIIYFTATCNQHVVNIQNSLVKKNTLYDTSEQNLLISNVLKFIEFILHFTNNNKKCYNGLSTLSLYITHILNEMQNKIVYSDIISGQKILHCVDDIQELIIFELNKK
jgi:hypothetical protein